MKRWAVWDTETTGLLIPGAPLDKQPHIIEFGAIMVAINDAGEMDTTPHPEHPAGQPFIDGQASWLINPGVPLEPIITKITGLTDDDLRGKPSFAEVLPEIVAFFLGVHGMVAHNLPFDKGMLVTELQRLGKEHAFPYPPEQICTVAHFVQTFGRRAKLNEVYKRVLGADMPIAHRALDDANMLTAICIKAEVLG